MYEQDLLLGLQRKRIGILQFLAAPETCACMAVSNNGLFRRLCRLFEEFARSSVSDTDEMLLGGSGAKDRIAVEV